MAPVASMLRPTSLNLAALCALLVACGSDDGGSSASGGTGATSTGGAGAVASGGTGAVGAGAAAAGGTGAAGGGGEPTPTLPAPTAACPPFTNGSVATFTVGGEPREAKIWIDEPAAAASDGPLVMYWYGTGGQPDQAIQGLTQAGIDRIVAAGGIVVAPVHVPIGVFPWIEAAGADYPLADEIVACAESEVGIDDRHIHSLGFSAGALHTTNLSFERSSYIASVATYSGGGQPVNVQDPNNKFAAMIFHGGSGDQVIIQFQEQSELYHDALTSAGHFAFICNHGRGHQIPQDAAMNVLQFFEDHGYGTEPSPYEGGLPADFPSYCSL